MPPENPALLSTLSASGLSATTTVVQAAKAGKRPFVSYAKLSKGGLTTCDLQIGGRTLRSDGTDQELLIVGAANEAIEVVTTGVGSDASFIATFGFLQDSLPGTGT